MIEEKLAEEYVSKLLNTDDENVDKLLEENLGDLKMNKRQADTILGVIKGVGVCSYLAGLKAKTQWHDLRENPDDLPPVESGCATIDVLTDGKKIAYYYYTESCWVDSTGEIDPPKAWCEIPTFKE